MNLRTAKTTEERKSLVEKELGVDLTAIGTTVLTDTLASERNCENMIGAVQVPLGIAGPIKINWTISSKQKTENREQRTENEKICFDDQIQSKNYELRTKNYFIPLATTEGALVASVNRGCKAISESGGAAVTVKTIGVTRGPVFSIKTEEERERLEDFLTDQTATIKKIAEQTSGHLTFLRSETLYDYPYGFVRFYFDTGDAMGMNMVSIATHAIADYIGKTLGIRCIAVSGNFCVDKKPCFQNFQNGRGKWVTAEVQIPEPVLGDVLKTTAENFFEVWHAKCVIGSKLTGVIGGNAQIANIVAALFLATGQDVAHVTEGSMGVTTTDYMPDRHGVIVRVVMPDVMVGTVGGGTGLPTQRESLEILGIAGGKNGENAFTLAGIVGAAALAGEISLIASLAQGSLGEAHERLGRGRVRGLDV